MTTHKEEHADDIETRLHKIESRNARVEDDKRWETSTVRKVSIAVLTYVIACLFLIVIRENKVLMKGLIPVLGFILSTMTLKIIRNKVKY